MAYSKVILNGNTLMDTTDKTVDAGSMLSGITALKNDGTTATGTIQSRTASDLTASGATVTVPAGNYASQATKSVAAGTEGTPTATKGTVSNHSVTVTPSVTNTAGYISGGTKTGTGVSVNVSELESGTKSITANGTGISVSGYSAVDVAVPSSSPTLITKSIAANGTYDAEDDNADGYSSVTVNVSGGGGSGLVYEMGTYTPVSDSTTVTIPFTNTHSEPPFYFIFSDADSTVMSSGSTAVATIYNNSGQLFGPYSIDGVIYGSVNRQYSANASPPTGNPAQVVAMLTTPYTDSSDSNVYNSRHWATETQLKAEANGRYWRSGRTYKWIAIWKPST